MYRVVFTSAADKEYGRLPRDVQAKVTAMLSGNFREQPLSNRFKVRKVEKPFTGYRLRLGSYRILFELEEKTIVVYRVRHRKDAYK